MKKNFLIAVFLLVFLYFSEGSLLAAASQRFISLAPAITEILFALGLKDEVVGVTTFCNYPPETKSIEKVGTFSEPSIEKIVSLRPDLIFATGLEQDNVVNQLKQLNLKVYVSDPKNIEELLESIRQIGRLTNKQEQALVLIEGIQHSILQIQNKVKQIPEEKKPKVFIEIWHDPLMTAGHGSFVDELITLAGGVNIAYDTPRAYGYFSAENVIERNPDCIIFGYMDDPGSQNQASRRLGWNQINAVKNNRLHNDINPDLIFRPGPRLVNGLEEIYQRLHNKQ